MKRLLVFLFVVSLYAPTCSFGWGSTGHKLVAMVAQDNLSNKAKDEIKKLMGTLDLSAIASWADEVKHTDPALAYTADWHFVDIPWKQKNYDSSQVCKNGVCVIAALNLEIAVIKDQSQSLTDRQNALKFIVHLVGDMHQPLHCYNNNDVGGNQITVKWMGQDSNEFGAWNLHAVWDDGMIGTTHLSYNAYKGKLEAWLKTQSIKKLTAGSFISWALASHDITQKKGVIVANHSSLSTAYQKANIPIVDRQLATGGIRLAKVLNDIYK